MGDFREVKGEKGKDDKWIKDEDKLQEEDIAHLLSCLCVTHFSASINFI